MKLIISFIAICFVFNCTNAQSNIPTPEFKNTINHVDTIINKLSTLEKVNGKLNQKKKVFGFAGIYINLSLFGKSSTVSFDQNQATFVVKLPDADTDPSVYVELYRFTIDWDNRIALVSAIKATGGSKQAPSPKVDLAFTKIIPGVYLVTIPQNLAKGNYGFLLDAPSLLKQANEFSGATIYAFDIN